MNEEKLANTLNRYLDTLLEAKALPESPPEEVAQLLEVAQKLMAAAPVPRPEFGPALKESLLGPTSSGNGTGGPTGSVPGGHVSLVVVGGLLILAAALALLIGAVTFGVSRSDIFRLPLPTLVPDPAQTVPGPPASPAPIVEPTTAGKASDTISRPTPTTTVILDILPQVTTTVGAAEDLPPPPALVPGPSSPGDGDGGDDGGDDCCGDPDRGHGNDDDHHDEDNPGHD